MRDQVNRMASCHSAQPTPEKCSVCWEQGLSGLEEYVLVTELALVLRLLLRAKGGADDS